MSQSQSQPPLTPSYLRSLPSIRQRSSLIYSLALADKLQHFTLHEDKLDTVVDYCIKVIKRDYGEDYQKIPGHSRWRHFVTPQRGDLLGGVIAGWQGAAKKGDGQGVGKREVVRRLVDLFVVSVLLDAGAGPTWKYLYEPTGELIGRSEGLAVASLDMFLSGAFSSSSSTTSSSNSNDANKDKERVDSIALKNLTTQTIREGLQGEKMTGLEGRAGLLIRLGEALEARPEVFKDSQGVFRPGNMVDYLYPEGPTNETSTETETQTPTRTPKIQVGKLWEVVMDGFGPIWPASPERTNLEGVSLGDAWKCAVLAKEESEVGGAAGIVPFHKLSQWMTYSLMEPLQKILGVEIEGVEQMTGLPEYRNGGLLLDLGFLVLKNNQFGESQKSAKDDDDTPPSTPSERWTPQATVDSQTVIEWRALTVIALDKIAQRIREKLNAPDLSTAQVLEAATWKAGREVAKELRESGGPPIEIVSDGTVF